MSFDLMVFDPAVAPRNRASFMAWYDKQAEWSEDHGYVIRPWRHPCCSRGLQRWRNTSRR